MNLTEKYMTKNDCYKQGRTMKPAGIMVHSTACPGVMASAWFDRWNKQGVTKCVHAFVDDQDVIQYLPWTMRGWHAGGSANQTHIGFEICEDKYHTEDYFRSVWKQAVELTAVLCRQYDLTEKDVISHREGHRKAIASNHGDPDHWWKKFGKTMDDFRADVARTLTGSEIDLNIHKEKIDMELMKVTVEDYLNLRDKPANNGKIIGKLLPGQLVEAGENKNGWRAIGQGWAYGGNGYLTPAEAVTLTLPADAARQLADALHRAGIKEA